MKTLRIASLIVLLFIAFGCNDDLTEFKVVETPVEASPANGGDISTGGGSNDCPDC